jgi:hypothetical protein
LYNVASLIPIFRHTSLIAIPVSDCSIANIICASVNLVFFMSNVSFIYIWNNTPISTISVSGLVGGGHLYFKFN